MSNLLSELQEILEKHGINFCPLDQKSNLIKEIRNKYVEGNPRALWLSFKNIVSVKNYDNNMGYTQIPEEIKTIEKDRFHITNEVYFIADDDNEEFYVFKITIDLINDIIENCQYFEYYIVPLDLSWLIAENDHGALIIC